MTPHQQESLPRSPETRKSLLSMRETPERRHQISPETIDPSLPRDPAGVLPMPEEDLQSMKDVPGRGANRLRPSLRLSSKQYEYLFGDDAEAAERFAQKEMSKKQGRFQSRMARVQSALENFIPEVRPGNQTALNTRAAPFAAFIARMHRSIHELWGFGFLEELEAKSASSPYNDRSLVSKLEIVLNGDGTVDKVTVIRPSGYLPYDVAAIDVVYSAGPYPDPPRAIRSRNGKIYVHWTFHRDERQCATSGVDYYILDNPPAGRRHGRVGVGAGAGGAQPRGRPRGPPAGRRRPPCPSRRGTARPAAARARPGRPGWRRLGRGAARRTRASRAEPDHEASRRAVQQVVRSDDPAARGVAEHWFDAYVHGRPRPDGPAGGLALPVHPGGGRPQRRRAEQDLPRAAWPRRRPSARRGRCRSTPPPARAGSWAASPRASRTAPGCCSPSGTWAATPSCWCSRQQHRRLARDRPGPAVARSRCYQSLRMLLPR